MSDDILALLDSARRKREASTIATPARALAAEMLAAWDTNDPLVPLAIHLMSNRNRKPDRGRIAEYALQLAMVTAIEQADQTLLERACLQLPAQVAVIRKYRDRNG